MLNTHELEILKGNLPRDWVEKVKAITGYSASRIRQAINNPLKYNKEIITAAITVGKEFKVAEALDLEQQKASIQELAS